MDDEEWSAFGTCIFCLSDMPHEPTELCEELEEEVETAERVLKEVGTMLDPISTGRKRAAAALPTEEFGTCEWAFLKRAGGGPVPIVGCLGNPATDRHHGPDKSTLNNNRPLDEGETNLHAICSPCHNQWHAYNDQYYGEGGAKGRPEDNSTWLPVGEVEWFYHDPDTKADQLELLNAQRKRLERMGIK